MAVEIEVGSAIFLLSGAENIISPDNIIVLVNSNLNADFRQK